MSVYPGPEILEAWLRVCRTDEIAEIPSTQIPSESVSL